MIMLRMLTTSSLSALSTIQPPSGPLPSGQVDRVRAPVPPRSGVGGAPAPAQGAAPSSGGAGSVVEPGSRTLPRGSLLDLSI